MTWVGAMTDMGMTPYDCESGGVMAEAGLTP